MSDKVTIRVRSRTAKVLRVVAGDAGFLCDRGTLVGQGSLPTLVSRMAANLEVKDGHLVMKPIELGEPTQATLLLETVVAMNPISGGGTDE